MIQCDGLPGPTHGFGGLSPGNLASGRYAHTASSPRRAARQCLAKMRLVLGLGMTQAFLPPLHRPHRAFLDACAGWNDPWLLRVASSSAFAWTANAGTVAQGDDGVVRMVVANLATLPHRQLEGPERYRQLLTLAPGLEVLPPLPSHPELGDEGAANHSTATGPRGTCEVFVTGRAAGERRAGHPARQTQEASAAVARRLRIAAPLLVRQLPAAIDAGAFHNDVVMVGEGDHLLLHPQAWEHQDAALATLTTRCGPLQIQVVHDLTLEDAVQSYLFNSQLLNTPTGWVLVAPAQCQDGPAAKAVRRLVEEGFIHRAVFVDLRESMMGGGGPACLRLRLPIAPTALHPALVLDENRIQALEAWVDTYYRDHLTPEDLADPLLWEEADRALEALGRLGLPLTTPPVTLP